MSEQISSEQFEEGSRDNLLDDPEDIDDDTADSKGGKQKDKKWMLLPLATSMVSWIWIQI